MKSWQDRVVLQKFSDALQLYLDYVESAFICDSIPPITVSTTDYKLVEITPFNSHQYRYSEFKPTVYENLLVVSDRRGIVEAFARYLSNHLDVPAVSMLREYIDDRSWALLYHLAKNSQTQRFDYCEIPISFKKFWEEAILKSISQSSKPDVVYIDDSAATYPVPMTGKVSEELNNILDTLQSLANQYELRILIRISQDEFIENDLK